MIERRPLLNVFSHVVLILGVLVVAFPLYLTFVASTQTSEAIVQTPMPMLPGSRFECFYNFFPGFIIQENIKLKMNRMVCFINKLFQQEKIIPASLHQLYTVPGRISHSE